MFVQGRTEDVPDGSRERRYSSREGPLVRPVTGQDGAVENRHSLAKKKGYSLSQEAQKVRMILHAVKCGINHSIARRIM
jgi:hypothetical protein